ncbi:MAG: SagB/ThcOx family dehydrogenase [Acidobacteria bacterium]|nr:SagB/ThcOx family dehydrogenase [Acidobacteriota bacterium]
MSTRSPGDVVLRYHGRSTHRPERFAPGPGGLDWANQPDPFRSWAGAPTVELPLAGDDLTASWDDLHQAGTLAPRPFERSSLGAFLELALGLTAWKQHGASRWSLRANPSSGNLHPTEGYVLVAGGPGLEAGLYHYLSRDHVLERRWTPEPADRSRLGEILSHQGFLVGLASIHWREAWKYGERAFRYCQHDAGHALATLRYAAAVLGWSARLLESPGDDDVAALLGLDRDEALATPDREHPDALVVVAPPAARAGAISRAENEIVDLLALARRGTWSGQPNALSSAHVEWSEIDTVAAATRKPRSDPTGDATFGEAPPSPGPNRPAAGCLGQGHDSAVAIVSLAAVTDPDRATPRAVALIRQRRSAVAMDGRTPLAADRFFEILDALRPRLDAPPWDVLPWRPRIHPVLFVHRVDGLPPGLYLLERDGRAHDALRAATRPSFAWESPQGVPSRLRLFLLEEGDARSVARFVSCQQGIASESAFSLGMLSLFETSLDEGPWWYRRLFWECGVLGQVLYLEAEAAGLRGTGIGCYLDDVVHELLGLEGSAFRDLYHFTVGGPVEDPRLATLPAYPDTVRRR